MEIPATAVDFFASATSSVETDITKKARESFDKKVNAEPVVELQKQEWKDRTEFPIGMSDKGDFFYQADNENSTRKQVDTNDDGIQEEKPWWKFW